MIIGVVLFLLGLVLMWLALKNLLQADQLQTLSKSANLESVLQETKRSSKWRLFQLGIISWTLGAMLLVYQLSHKDDTNLKLCHAACLEQGYSRAKWPGFCRCLEGLRHLDIDLPDDATK